MFPKLYIETKSGATFSAGSESGSVTNKDGCGVVDLSSVYAGKVLKPGTSHTFTVNVSGEADIDDIVGITMTQRILTSMAEFGTQAVYGEGVSDDVVTPDEPETPVVPEDPEEPSEPEDPEDPVDPEDPEDPVDPEEPVVPEDPEDPDDGKTEGTYAAWQSGATYKLGDLVSYQGKVYECTYAHTSHMGWLPGEAFTLWKERTDLVNVENPDAGEEGGDDVTGGEEGGDDVIGGEEGGDDVTGGEEGSDDVTGGEEGGDDVTGGDEGDDDVTGGETTWDANTVYLGGDTVLYNGKTYRAGWWTLGENPETCGQWGVWKLVD